METAKVTSGVAKGGIMFRVPFEMECPMVPKHTVIYLALLFVSLGGVGAK